MYTKMLIEVHFGEPIVSTKLPNGSGLLKECSYRELCVFVKRSQGVDKGIADRNTDEFRRTHLVSGNMLTLAHIFFYDAIHLLMPYPAFKDMPVFAKYEPEHHLHWHLVNIGSFDFPDVLEYSTYGRWMATKKINPTRGYTLIFEDHHDLTMFILYGLKIDA